MLVFLFDMFFVLPVAFVAFGFLGFCGVLAFLASWLLGLRFFGLSALGSVWSLVSCSFGPWAPCSLGPVA